VYTLYFTVHFGKKYNNIFVIIQYHILTKYFVFVLKTFTTLLAIVHQHIILLIKYIAYSFESTVQYVQQINKYATQANCNQYSIFIKEKLFSIFLYSTIYLLKNFYFIHRECFIFYDFIITYATLHN
jgi:hypothetical protein